MCGFCTYYKVIAILKCLHRLPNSNLPFLLVAQEASFLFFDTTFSVVADLQ